MSGRAFLLVDPNRAFVEEASRAIRIVGPVRGAASAAEALNALRSADSWYGFLINLELPDGCGFNVLEAAARHDPVAARAVMAASVDAGAANRACALGASYVCKPLSSTLLEAFASEATANRRTWARSIEWLLDGMTAQYRLSRAERAIVAASLRGEHREDMASSRDVSVNTLKTQIRRLLLKTGDETLGQLRDRVLRQLASSPNEPDRHTSRPASRGTLP